MAPVPAGTARSRAEPLAAASVALLVTALAVAAAAVIVTGSQLVAYHWELPFIGSEFINVFHAGRLAGGEGLYVDPGVGTWSFPVYFPGMYALLAPLSWIDGEGPIWLQRLAMLAALTGVAALAAVTARRLGAGIALAVASGLALFAFEPVGYLVAVVRPDVLGLLFAAAAVATVTRWEDERRARWIAIAALLCAATILVRQVYAPIPLALAIAVLVRDRGAGFRLLAGTALAAMLGLAITELASGGGFSADQRAFTDLFALSSLAEAAEAQLLPPNVLYVVGAAGCALGLAGSGRRAAHFAWVGAAVACLAAVKVGSSGNYFLPLMWTSAVLVGPTLASVGRRFGPAALTAGAALTAALLIAPVAGAIDRARSFDDGLAPLEDGYAEAVQRIEASPGEVLGDRFDLLLAAGKEPTFEALLLAQIETTGGDTPDDLVAAVAEGRFALLQSSFDLRGTVPAYQELPFWPDSVVSAARERYCELWAGGRLDLRALREATLSLRAPIKAACGRGRTRARPALNCSGCSRLLT